MDPHLYGSLRREAPPLRVGLLLDSVVLPRCFAEAVDQIVESDFARLDLLVFNAAARQPAAAGPRHSLLRRAIDSLADGKRRRRLLFTLYEKWDRRHINPATDPLAPVDCSARLEGIDALRVTPAAKRFVHRFPAEAIERIKAKELDVLIRFGFNILRGDILTAAKYGVWSYHHGDNEYYRGGPAYFWEVYEGNPISGAVLQVLTEELDAGKVLYKGLFATHPGLSQACNRVQPYWGASTFLIQKLRELHGSGWEQVERNMVKPSPYLGKKKIYSAPGNREMLRWLGPAALRRAGRRMARRETAFHWMMAMRSGAAPLIESAGKPDLSGFRWIESPRNRFYADPFLIEHEGKTWVFFEDFDYARQIGRISCAEAQAGGLATPVTALERPYHLSYPCVFRDGGELYMIPETSANGTVELYRCARFPDAWELERVLLDARAVDSTVWIEDGVYWLFATMQEPRGQATQLWLFHADGLEGSWTAHPANPISTDVRNSRGAGAIFRHCGKLIRPSQDCSRNYGGSFTLNEIAVLNRLAYQERPHMTVKPAWPGDWVGTHTYNRSGDIEVIDGCARIPASRVLAR